MTLENFAYKMLLKSYLKIKIELQHVIKRASRGLGLEMIFISPRLGERKHATLWIKKNQAKGDSISYPSLNLNFSSSSRISKTLKSVDLNASSGTIYSCFHGDTVALTMICCIYPTGTPIY